jgi:GNAT superfamily N-acetyltransferase
MIHLTDSLDTITSDQLSGFFVGWPNPPTPETHLILLKQSSRFVLAIDDEHGGVIGFVTAISDGVLAAYIPFLEVLPDYQGRGIGQQLVKRILDLLGDLYMVDLLCDGDLQPFYERLGMTRATGMMLRRYEMQSGSNRSPS